MFNWDSDYDDLVEDRSDLLRRETPSPTKAGIAPGSSLRDRAASVVANFRGFAGKWAMAGAVAVMLGALGTTAVFVPRDGGPSVAAFAEWSLALVGLGGQMPEGLLAYEQAQFDNFRRGISGFTDADLFDYLRANQRDLEAGSPTSDFTRDALFLAHREVERRGLPMPVASLDAGTSSALSGARYR